MARSYDIAILSQKVEQMEGKIVANDVIANPTGDTTADLTKVQIDGTKYKVSNVKVNPTGEITNDATGLEIDGVKYKIPLPTITIAHTTFTATTLSNGTVATPNNVIPLLARRDGAEGYCYIGYNDRSSADTNFIKVTDLNGAAITSTEVTIDLFYLVETTQESTRSTKKKSKKED